MRETVLGKTTRYAEDEGEAAGSYKYCKAARAAPNRTGRAKPKEAAHRRRRLPGKRCVPRFATNPAADNKAFLIQAVWMKVTRA